MKYAKLLSLSLVVFTLFGCNQTSTTSQIGETVEAANPPQEENSFPQQEAANIEAPSTSKIQNSSPRKVVQNIKPKTQKQNSSSQYGTLEELNAKIKKRNGRIIGSASCDGDGKENDVRVDYNGDGMPDECVIANLKIHPSIQEETLETVTYTLNFLEKGCNTTSKSQGNYDYYICKKDGEIVKAIKSQKESAASVMYWFENRKPLAVQRIDSNYKNDFFVYYPDGKLSSIFSIVDPRNDISKRILNFNNQQIQEAGNLVNSYQDIFQVFAVN